MRAAISTATVSPARLVISVSSRSASSPSRRSITSASPMNDEIIRCGGVVGRDADQPAQAGVDRDGLHAGADDDAFVEHVEQRAQPARFLRVRGGSRRSSALTPSAERDDEQEGERRAGRDQRQRRRLADLVGRRRLGRPACNHAEQRDEMKGRAVTRTGHARIRSSSARCARFAATRQCQAATSWPTASSRKCYGDRYQKVLPRAAEIAKHRKSLRGPEDRHRTLHAFRGSCARYSC